MEIKIVIDKLLLTKLKIMLLLKIFHLLDIIKI